jgi:hypothetical protein
MNVVTVGPSTAKIEFVKPRSSSIFDIDDTDPAADELQMGLFDNLMEVAPPTPPRFLNDASDADNWVGGDSRRFYLRVVDPSAKGRNFLEADVEWWTSFANNDRRDHAAHEVEDDPSSKLSLFEVPAKPGTFVSRGLMIVGDNEDRALPMNSGVPAGHPLAANHAGSRTDKQSNFRVRRGGMHSFAVAAYTRKGTTITVKTTPVPVFKTSSQHLLPLQVFVVRTSVGGAPAIDPDLVFKNDLLEVTETYGRIGLWCWTFVDTSNPAVTVVKATTGVPYSLGVVNPPSGISIANLDKTGMRALGNAFPGQPNTLRLFFVSSLAGSFQGMSFPQSDATVLDPVGTTFVNAAHNPYTTPHELGHCLTDKPGSANGGHYDQSLAGPRQPAPLNLMAGFGGLPGRGVTQAKRLWEFDPGFKASGGVPIPVLAKILGSPFTR